jgi:hypothetical protein
MEHPLRNKKNRALTRQFIFQWLILGMAILAMAGIMGYYFEE